MLHRVPRSVVVGIAMIAAGVVVFVVGALGAPHPEQPEWYSSSGSSPTWC
jgi:hypothetical protein